MPYSVLDAEIRPCAIFCSSGCVDKYLRKRYLHFPSTSLESKISKLKKVSRRNCLFILFKPFLSYTNETKILNNLKTKE